MDTLLHVEFYTKGRKIDEGYSPDHNGIMTAAEALEMAQGRIVVLLNLAEPGETRCGFGNTDSKRA